LFDRRLVKHFDWFLLCLVLVICGAGLANLYSATVRTEGEQVFYRQFLWVCIGLGLVMVSLFFNYHLLERVAVPLYVLTLILLIGPLLLGPVLGGSKRWIILGPVSFQPSELAKPAMVVMMARIFYRKNLNNSLGLRDLFAPFLVMALPAVLILKEPDLGTAILFVLIGLSILLFIRVRWQVTAACVSGVILSLPFLWKVLKDYQKKRILTFFNPEWDPLGAGYHVTQSKIAVGSGRLAGKGYLSSTQSHLNFLPEHHTDFAFSVLAEEWGFIGSLVVMALFLTLVLWGLNIGRRSKDLFGSLLAVGLVAILFWPVVINVGMVTGILPVVGIPLPLISYGGSNALSTLFAAGLLMNISMRRFMFK
jgi:rod shape determining protein RodA